MIDIDITSTYKISDNLISREIEETLVIVPLDSGMGDINSELYSLNETGSLVWEKLDGLTPINEIIDSISLDFNLPTDKIKQDIINLLADLLKKGLIKKI